MQRSANGPDIVLPLWHVVVPQRLPATRTRTSWPLGCRTPRSPTAVDLSPPSFSINVVQINERRFGCLSECATLRWLIRLLSYCTDHGKIAKRSIEPCQQVNISLLSLLLVTFRDLSLWCPLCISFTQSYLFYNHISARIQLLIPPQIHRPIQQRQHIRIKRLPVRIVQVILLTAFLLVAFHDREFSFVVHVLHDEPGDCA